MQLNICLTQENAVELSISVSAENTKSITLSAYITRNFVICTPEQKPLGWSNTEERGGLVMWYVWGQGEVHTGFGW